MVYCAGGSGCVGEGRMVVQVEGYLESSTALIAMDNPQLHAGFETCEHDGVMVVLVSSLKPACRHHAGGATLASRYTQGARREAPPPQHGACLYC